MMSRYESPSKWNKSVASFVHGNIGTFWPSDRLISCLFFDLEYFKHNEQFSKAFLVGHLILANILFVLLTICIFEVLDNYYGFD